MNRMNIRTKEKRFPVAPDLYGLFFEDISRAGDGTKIVLTGDPGQIDNPYLDGASNGLSYVSERLKGNPLHGHITLRKSERSELAALAAQLL